MRDRWRGGVEREEQGEWEIRGRGGKQKVLRSMERWQG